MGLVNIKAIKYLFLMEPGCKQICLPAVEGHCLKKENCLLNISSKEAPLVWGRAHTPSPSLLGSPGVQGTWEGVARETAVSGLQSGARKSGQGTEVTHIPAPSRRFLHPYSR